MSFPNIPDIAPTINLDREQVVNLLLASIAFEELGLAHIINSEAEKIQFVLGTLAGQTTSVPPTIEEIISINKSVNDILRAVIDKQILLQFKIEDTLDIPPSSTTTGSTTTTTTASTTSTTESTTSTTESTTSTTESTTSTTESTTSTTESTTSTTESTTSTTESTTSTTTTTTTTSTTTTSTTESSTTTTSVDAGSAWSVGTSFGMGNAQYTTLGAAETEKSVTLGLGHNYIPVGTVTLQRDGNNLLVTFLTIPPYVMSQVHLYVSNVAPTDSNPGGFPYQHTVTDPADYFTTYTFIIDVSAFAGQTIYVAAHAHIFLQV